MKGIITNIQRFSLTDGDGIRTTVFFKGCNMKCEWCHNPETMCATPELMFYRNKCIGCGKCFEVCPVGAHKTEEGKHIIDRTLCTSCGKCAAICYAQALVMCGEEKTVEDVMREVRQDREYYKNSGGGVTLSGGEVLCHKAFAISLCKALKEEEIPVAIETNLSFDFEFAKELLCLTDLVMCDIKLFDDETHKKYTGVSNVRVLENIKKLDSLGIPFIVRTPLIPEVTDTNENICRIADFLKGMKNLRRYELLSFNPLGEGKYKALDVANKYEVYKGTSKEKLSMVKTIMENSGIPFKIV